MQHAEDITARSLKDKPWRKRDWDGKFGYVIYEILPGIYIGLDDDYYSTEEGCNRFAKQVDQANGIVMRERGRRGLKSRWLNLERRYKGGGDAESDDKSKRGYVRRTSVIMDIHDLLGVEKQRDDTYEVIAFIKQEELHGLDVVLKYGGVAEYRRFEEEQIREELDFADLKGMDPAAALSFREVIVDEKDGQERKIFVLDLEDRLKRYFEEKVAMKKNVDHRKEGTEASYVEGSF